MSRVRANNFVDKVGTGAPTFPYGVNVTGVATATTLAISGNAVISGNLQVDGTQTIINTSILDIEAVSYTHLTLPTKRIV